MTTMSWVGGHVGRAPATPLSGQVPAPLACPARGPGALGHRVRPEQDEGPRPRVPGTRPFAAEPLCPAAYLRIRLRSTYCMMPPLR